MSQCKEDFIPCIYSAALLPAPLHSPSTFSERTCRFSGWGQWAVFPKNAWVVRRALLGLEGRAYECLSRLINLDRQHQETSNLHDNQQRTQAAGHLFMFHQIFSPSVKSNVPPFRPIFRAEKTRADSRTVSWSCVDIQCLTGEPDL